MGKPVTRESWEKTTTAFLLHLWSKPWDALSSASSSTGTIDGQHGPHEVRPCWSPRNALAVFKAASRRLSLFAESLSFGVLYDSSISRWFWASVLSWEHMRTLYETTRLIDFHQKITFSWRGSERKASAHVGIVDITCIILHSPWAALIPLNL